MSYIKKFSEISKEDVGTVGGKGASLGEMTKASIRVPSGFVITAQTHQKFLNDSLPVDVEQEILKAFDELGVERVAVRSSAVAEDSSQASWAGQLETYLNVSREDLINKVRECWNSIKSERALSYAGEKDLSENELFVAVVVQKMIESKSSGVMFSINPISKNSNEIMIEAGYGLGEMLVQGLIIPDNFIVDKESLEIKSKDIQSQDTMLLFIGGENKEVSVPEDQKSAQAVSDEVVKALAKMAVKIELQYEVPQDIEWAIDDQNKIWILQSRPITTL